MKENQGSEVKQVGRANRHRRKWPIALVAVLAIVAAAFYFRGPTVNEQLKELAGQRGGLPGGSCGGGMVC
ncbi:MAG: hypothetical protein ACYS8Z_01420 [Planctomycetota bacterium]|jgi:hypothetical protein